ncbi:hypothetical protein AURDEDRAFT_163493 [Auricularia subglabra TFB-10046 SS5]|nr:hypothetical protein AURDEDRAFT_163493 [Auricularia subglabra TFB-10046 SS5]
MSTCPVCQVRFEAVLVYETHLRMHGDDPRINADPDAQAVLNPAKKRRKRKKAEHTQGEITSSGTMEDARAPSDGVTPRQGAQEYGLVPQERGEAASAECAVESETHQAGTRRPRSPSDRAAGAGPAKRAREEEQAEPDGTQTRIDAEHQLASDAEVQSYGLVVNQHYRLVICADPSCEYALAPTARSVSEHLAQHGRSVRESTAGAWLARHAIPNVAVIPPPRCAAVSGIVAKNGVACRVPGCSYACESESMLRSRHRINVHPEIDSLPFERVPVQLVFATGSHRQYIEVALPREEDAHGDVSSVILGHDERLERERAMLNLSGSVKDTSQWLVRSGILAFAARFTQAELLGRAALTTLPQVRSGWLAVAAESAASTEPDKRPLSRIDNTAKYRGIFVRLVSFVLRNAQSAADAPFSISTEQSAAAAALLHICKLDSPPAEELRSALQRFSYSIFAQDYDGEKAYSSALIAFVFLSTLDQYNGYFLPPALVTPLTAALSYTARCVIFRQIVEDATGSGETTFKTMPKHLRWIKVGAPNAFDSLRQAHDLARNISMHAASPDRVFWAAGNKTSFRYRGHPIQISAIQRMVQGMASRLDQLQAALSKHADLDDPSLVLPSVLHDDPANVQPGYSFVSEPANGIDRTAYAHQLLSSGHFCKFHPGADTPTWIQSACNSWKADYLEFSALRATMMHMLAGQPPRGTEALQTLIVNSDRRRSLLFTEEPELLWVLDYNKSSEMTGGFDRTIIRALDQHLGDIVKRDVAFMRTFAQVLADEVFHCGADSVLMGYKFLNRGIFGCDIGTDEVSATLRSYSAEYLDLSLTVSDWRHIMTAISRHLITDLGVATTALQADLDYQEGHSSLTAQLHYGRERNGLTSELISRFLPLSRCVHKILKRPLAIPADAVPIESVNDSPETPAAIPLCADAVVRGVVDGLVPHLRSSRLDERVVADNIISYLEQRVREIAVSVVAQTGAGIVDELRHQGFLPLYPTPERRPQRQPAVVLDRKGREPLASLRAFLNISDARFLSPAQRDALEAIIRHEGHTATFLPTAGGKSMLWQLTCAHFDKPTDVTVVYVPWVVLAEAHVRASRAGGVPSCIWRRDNPRFEMLTFVIPEAGSGDDFHAGLRELSAAQRLRRFFLDEVHAWVTDSSYRPALLDASELSTYAVPIHLVSATIPIDVYHCALRQLGIASIAAPQVFRERSVRMSIRYCVFELPEHAFVDHIAAAAHRLLTQPPDRGIVFVRRTADADSVAQRLGCDAFHSGLAPEDRTAVLERWESGQHPLIVATTLLSTGYHVPGVRLVVEYGPSWNYITHSQGTGRGGRGDTYCEAHVLFDRSADYWVANPGDFGHREMMACIRNDSACMRAEMGRYLDGFGERCADLPPCYVPCSRCERDYVAPVSGGAIVPRQATRRGTDMGERDMEIDGPSVNMRLRMNAELVRLEQSHRLAADNYLRLRLDMLRGICRGCWLRAGLRRQDHATHACLENDNLVHAGVQTAKGTLTYAALKRDVRVNAGLCCIWCWVPRTPALHPHMSSHGNECEYEDIVPQICVGAWTSCREFLVASPAFPTVTEESAPDPCATMVTPDGHVALPVELVTKILKHRAEAHMGRQPGRIVEMVCLAKVHRGALERLLYDTVVLLSVAQLQSFLELVENRNRDGRPIRVRALSVSGHDGTDETDNRFLDLISLLAPTLSQLQAGSGYTGVAVNGTDVREMYLDEYADGHFTPLTIPKHTMHALTTLWLGPFPENMQRLDLMIVMMPSLRALGLIFVPCQPLTACRILDICARRGVERVHFVVQEWSLAGTLLSNLRLNAILDAHMAAIGTAMVYTVVSADPKRWGIGPHRAHRLPSLPRRHFPPTTMSRFKSKNAPRGGDARATPPTPEPPNPEEFCAECEKYIDEESPPHCRRCNKAYHTADACSGGVIEGLPFVCFKCHCGGCRKTAGFMLRCQKCSLAYHLDCADRPPRPDAVRLNKDGAGLVDAKRWYCQSCQDLRCAGCGSMYESAARTCRVCSDDYCSACELLVQGMTQEELEKRQAAQRAGKNSGTLYDWVCNTCTSCDVCLRPAEELLMRCDTCMRRVGLCCLDPRPGTDLIMAVRAAEVKGAILPRVWRCESCRPTRCGLCERVIGVDDYVECSCCEWFYHTGCVRSVWKQVAAMGNTTWRCGSCPGAVCSVCDEEAKDEFDTLICGRCRKSWHAKCALDDGEPEVMLVSEVHLRRAVRRICARGYQPHLLEVSFAASHVEPAHASRVPEFIMLSGSHITSHVDPVEQVATRVPHKVSATDNDRRIVLAMQRGPTAGPMRCAVRVSRLVGTNRDQLLLAPG